MSAHLRPYRASCERAIVLTWQLRVRTDNQSAATSLPAAVERIALKELGQSRYPPAALILTASFVGPRPFAYARALA